MEARIETEFFATGFAWELRKSRMFGVYNELRVFLNLSMILIG